MPPTAVPPPGSAAVPAAAPPAAKIAASPTVHEGSVRKYLEVSKQIAIKYKIDPYTHQRILLLERSVESLFQNDKVKKAKLSDFF